MSACQLRRTVARCGCAHRQPRCGCGLRTHYRQVRCQSSSPESSFAADVSGSSSSSSSSSSSDEAFDHGDGAGEDGGEVEADDGVAREYVTQGTLFEQLCGDMLEEMGASISLVGGRSDGGIDISGSFPASMMRDQARHQQQQQAVVDQANTILDFVAQCKSSKRKVGVQLLREFEGVLARQRPGTIGLYFVSQGYTIGATNHAATSRHPLALWTVTDGLAKVWQNPALRKRRLRLRPPQTVIMSFCPSARTRAHRPL
ncbi:hypothetical protein PTSG_06465 [Salpingoeca rosetta]|uniref:Restriction endonuclease type IV Mrr domain-containing protein n=1 Tax=Salpingoeca rosetta (strain ATCC 50818 / BSB-021) TaxID=946362 RepID=F2UFW0_SALR5|nr:uncharacterized protein PTSG_06465 [Salpingoeca rosetta]EGD75388.1 hypothetical protein PTSG_06465 [Salpingoeca rosetta]|eukprot:XP_004991845.1 hypothetical protein PTSG_06465 [Salpingoeca rosetta]